MNTVELAEQLHVTKTTIRKYLKDFHGLSGRKKRFYRKIELNQEEIDYIYEARNKHQYDRNCSFCHIRTNKIAEINVCGNLKNVCFTCIDKEYTKEDPFNRKQYVKQLVINKCKNNDNKLFVDMSLTRGKTPWGFI